jgi:hypothetical protein
MSTTGPVPNPAPPTAPAVAPATAPTPPTPPPIVIPACARDLLSRTTLPLTPVDYSLRGYHLDARVTPDKVVSAAVELDREGLALDTITGVDWMAEHQMEVVYDYFHPSTGLRVAVRSRIARENPEIPFDRRGFSRG